MGETFVPHALVGTTLAGQYRLVGLLGSGGIGHVFVAVPTLASESHRRIALKLLRPELGSRIHLVARFEREAMAAARIRHPHVLEVHGPVATAEQRLFFTMELLVGLDLADTMAHAGRLPLARAVRIVRSAASGLGAAHAAGVVHRDIKPENVFLVHAPDGSEHVKVLDFGAAFLIGDGASGRRITASAGIVGTPEYMAPEQLAGAEGHPSGDIYSLGILLFELVAGRAPFAAKGWLELAQLHQNQPLPNPERGSSELIEVLQRALAKDPEARYGSMEAFEAALAATPEAQKP